jgi:hypothetical protein
MGSSPIMILARAGDAQGTRAVRARYAHCARIAELGTPLYPHKGVIRGSSTSRWWG